VLKSYRPTEVRRVLEPHTVEVLTELLRGVVTGGTGRKAAIPGYAVAGKTGTAQKIDATGRYSMIDHVASFVGFVPASRPALLVLVSLDTPRGLRNQGGDVAAPLFARIAEPTLRYLAIPPDDTDRVLRLHAPAPESVLLAAYEPPRAGPTVTPTSSGEMPDLRGQSAREAAVGAARRGLMVQMSGSGRVVAQSPEPGAPLEPGALCQLTLAAANP
jgi:membrane peptidoglycan carboxypeptidase